VDGADEGAAGGAYGAPEKSKGLLVGMGEMPSSSDPVAGRGRTRFCRAPIGLLGSCIDMNAAMVLGKDPFGVLYNTPPGVWVVE
jgi:hypothetical protein